MNSRLRNSSCHFTSTPAVGFASTFRSCDEMSESPEELSGLVNSGIPSCDPDPSPRADRSSRPAQGCMPRSAFPRAGSDNLQVGAANSAETTVAALFPSSWQGFSRETRVSIERQSIVASRPRKSSRRWGSNWAATGWNPRWGANQSRTLASHPSGRVSRDRARALSPPSPPSTPASSPDAHWTSS